MIVRRERGESLEGDREQTRRLVETVRETGESSLRVWRPPPHVSFGRRDANSDSFERARTAAAERGYPTTVRSSGGRAVVHTDGTLAVVLAVPISDERSGIEARYASAIDVLQSALSDDSVDAERGEPPNSFCPGSHSLQVDGRKVVGLAQRVRRDVAVLAAIVVVRDEVSVADVLVPVYDALDVPLDPATVGSVASGGGPDDVERIGDAVVTALRGVDSR